MTIKQTLLEKVLDRIDNDIPVSKNVKGMFKNETDESYAERFRVALERSKSDMFPYSRLLNQKNRNNKR